MIVPIKAAARKASVSLLILAIVGCAGLPAPEASLQAESHVPEEREKPRNVIFILTDDQRYDALGFLNPVIDTPNMDRLAKEGAYYPNAFVTTALCSPSRATILTGQYMHNHGVVDNNEPIRDGTRFFPQYLQQAGYATAFIGKWHMGGHLDDPQPGFDHWVSFKGQGDYYPRADHPLNVDGKHVPQKGYITDELTDYAIDWLDKGRDGDKPFFLYLSHKAVHADFYPAKRHEKLYSERQIPLPESYADTPENYEGKPLWVQNQRNTWHGVDFPYHMDLDLRDFLLRYYQSLAAVDDSLGRILAYLEESGELDNTVILFMGDNGFLFGEHGLIDKRNAYEESMRVPLLAMAPGLIEPGSVVDEVVANLDIAPTVLDIAGIEEKPAQFEGLSFLPLTLGRQDANSWRKGLLYEYYWEFNYPHTPTTFALREKDYKFIMYHGVYDTEELYDLRNDPREMVNIVDRPEHRARRIAMRRRVHELLADRQGRHLVPYTEKYSSGAVLRSRDGKPAGDFPKRWLRDGTPPDRDQHSNRDTMEKFEKLDEEWQKWRKSDDGKRR